tara:strand:+ start:5635 stop:6123 length:489 start_codon:yes stop_codon:yes gene_type:complete
MSDEIITLNGQSAVESRFAKDWGEGVYERNAPDFYTTGMKFFARILNGKISGVVGWIDKGKFALVGGVFIHPDYRKGTPNYIQYGSTYIKLANKRAEILRGKPKIAGFKPINLPTKEKHFKETSHENIPEEVIEQFKQRYGDKWGIAKTFFITEDWFDILRT